MLPPKVALITGASTGIGAASARALARRGTHVVLVARTASKLEAVLQDIETAGGTGQVEPLDASDGEALISLASRLREAGTIPDVIVNSAGAGQWKYIEDTAPAEARQMMAAPYFAAFNTCHAFMRDLLARRSGTIIHIGSPAGSQAWPGAPGYIAARHALRGLNEALNQDLEGTGVRSCHLVLGEVTSNYFSANPDSHEHIPKVARLIRVMSPEEAAEAVLRAISKPKREIYYPFMLRVIASSQRVSPDVISWMTRKTGRKRR